MIEDSIFDCEKPKEECGIFGVFNRPDAAELTYLGLYALQHRGQQGAGIACSDGEKMSRYTGSGLVRDVFANEKILESLQGIHAIGHNRYSADTLAMNSQPILAKYKYGQLAAAHNGYLTNANFLRENMENDGAIFTTTTDTEVVMHLIARSKADTLAGAIKVALSLVEGAYSMVFLNNDQLFAARDPLGIRPLAIGKLGDNFVISSETCAFDLIEAELVREVEPGEIIMISKNGLESIHTFPNMAKRHAHCIFEYIYFSRPDSIVFNESVEHIRRAFGRQLAIEHNIPEGADFVMGVPDSANTAALGYSEGANLPFQLGLIRNHYVGRTFIRAGQSDRDFGVKVKFNPIAAHLKDKIVVIVDDSVVRGTTMRKIIKLVRNAQPKEIHLRISSPPVINPCFYGVDMANKEKFIANNRTLEEIREYLKVDSIQFLTVEGMLSVFPENVRKNYCCACFNGDYPICIQNCFEEPMSTGDQVLMF
jgi:amidophosphoribosyltransferase